MNFVLLRYYYCSTNHTRRGVLDVLTSLSDCRHETVERIMERRISGVSYMCWMDFHNAILCCGFLYARIMSLLFRLYFVSLLSFLLSLFRLPRRGLSSPGLSRPYHQCTAITLVYAPRLSRHSIFLLLGYHARAITLHHTRTSGYHTRHSSSCFIVYLSPAITPPVLLIYTTTGAPQATTYSTR